MPSITSANAILMLSVPTIINSPQQLQGYSADDIFTVGELASAEALMGIDGILSAGFVHVPIVQNYNLQADSASNTFFDTWWGAMQQNREVYPAMGSTTLPSILKQWSMTVGWLTSYHPVPDAAKTLRPRRFTITWQQVVATPISPAGV